MKLLSLESTPAEIVNSFIYTVKEQVAVFFNSDLQKFGVFINPGESAELCVLLTPSFEEAAILRAKIEAVTMKIFLEVETAEEFVERFQHEINELCFDGKVDMENENE